MAGRKYYLAYLSCLKGAMQRDFDDLILAPPKLFFFFLAANNSRILHKNQGGLKRMVNEKDTQ